MIQVRPFVTTDTYRRLNDVATEYGIEPSTVAARILENACAAPPPPPPRKPRRQVTPDMLQQIHDLDAQGISFAEIARHLDVTRPTIYNHINRARNLKGMP